MSQIINKHKFDSMKVDQGWESQGRYDHLRVFAESLSKARSMFAPTTSKELKQGERITSLMETVEKEHKRLLARKSIIEKRKEEQERQLLEMQEEESRRIKQQKIAEEAERRRLDSEYAQRRNQRILKEIEEKELEEARQLLKEVAKTSKKKGKKPIIEGEKITKHTLMEMVLNEQLKKRQEKEKKLQKLAKTMDHLERAKREEASPLVEAAFHHLEQAKREEASPFVEAAFQKRMRLCMMMEDKEIFQQRVLTKRESEFNKLKKERHEQIDQIIQSRKLERETMRKMICYLKLGEERLPSLPVRPLQSPSFACSSKTVPITANASQTSGKYVPRHLREKMGGGNGQTPPPSEPNRSGQQDDRPNDRWRPSGGQSRSTWSSSVR